MASLPSAEDERSRRPPERPAGRLLIVDDEPTVLRALRRILAADGHRIDVAMDAGAAWRALHEPGLDLVLLDPAAGGPDRPDWLGRWTAARPEVEVVVMTAAATVENAVAWMRRGASDVLAKPFHDLGRLRATVRRAVERGRERRAARSPDRAVAARPDLPVPASDVDATLPLSLEAYEKRALERALAECAGDATRAARALGIGRSTFYRKLAKHGLRARPIARERAAPARAVGLDPGVGGPTSIR